MSLKNYFALLEEIYNNVGQQFLISRNHSTTRIISFTKKRFKTEINCFCIRTLCIFFIMPLVFLQFWALQHQTDVAAPFPCRCFLIPILCYWPFEVSLTVAILLTAGAQTDSQLWATLGLIQIKYVPLFLSLHFTSFSSSRVC